MTRAVVVNEITHCVPTETVARQAQGARYHPEQQPALSFVEVSKERKVPLGDLGKHSRLVHQQATTSHERADSASKSAYVKEMFASIAPRYDLANRVLTAGFDELWRNRAIDQLHAQRGDAILDLCCGTGDICFHLIRRDKTLAVTGVDFCAPMLERARERAQREAPHARVEFVEADVMALPFADGTFAGATMGFSMRNVVDIDATLREIRRVLKSGARFVNLDVSKAPNRIFKRAFDVYFYGVVPLIGGIVGGSRTAYRYLPASLTHHPDAQALEARFKAAGFVESGYRALCGGTIAIHYGAAP